MYSIERFAIDAPGVIERVVELQRAAYALEAALIGFDDIPPLHELADDVMAFDFEWVGAFENGSLLGALAYSQVDAARDIDRLFVDPENARRCIGRSLVESVLDVPRITVSTGTGNVPAVNLYKSLGFDEQGRREIAPGVTVTVFQRTALPCA